jgi:hypothetical protein
MTFYYSDEVNDVYLLANLNDAFLLSGFFSKIKPFVISNKDRKLSENDYAQVLPFRNRQKRR